jgi:hypothetical protein
LFCKSITTYQNQETKRYGQVPTNLVAASGTHQKAPEVVAGRLPWLCGGGGVGGVYDEILVVFVAISK